MRSGNLIEKIHDDTGVLHIIYFGSGPHIIFRNTIKQMCRMIEKNVGKLNSRKMDCSFANILSQEITFLSFRVNSPSVTELFTLLTLLRRENKSISFIHSKITEFGQTRSVKNVLYMLIRVHTVTYISLRFLSPSKALRGKFSKLSKLFCIFLK